jgi:catechol 2,3-dioxygenase-like lactoylglutathione lyase family enzyme
MEDQGEARAERATTALLRAAGAAYRGSVRAELLEAGVDDLPRDGASVLARIAADQAVSNVDDILVRRGYVVGGPSPELTEHGQSAAEAVLRGLAEVDLQLAERIGAERVAVMREALRALAEISVVQPSNPSRSRRAGRQLRRFCPIFPVKDLRAALEHYAELGFRTEPYAEGDTYGFANREGVGLHLHESTYYGDRAAAYLYVRDADALYAEWSRPDIAGRTSAVHTTDYGMREGSHTDPDGNVIRFGSDVAED